MAGIEVVRSIERDGLAEVDAFLDRLSRATGHPALGEQQWLDLNGGGGAGFLAALTRDADGGLAGYAQAVRDGERWSMELAVDRELPADDVARAVLAGITEEGGREVALLLTNAGTAEDALAARLGLRPVRDVHNLRRPLPPAELSSIAVRPFRPHADEDSWLRVNNRAFADHPDQSAWTPEMLEARERLPWFDAAGFLLHEEEDRLAGFCWTKLHDADGRQLGEIYVIAVDPDFEGRGLGRELVLAGLDSLWRRGAVIGTLYVDGSNARARRLYERLGFTLDHVDRVYVGPLS